MDLQLSGRVVLVSGGTKGIGAAAARGFAAEGSHVVVIGRDAVAGARLVAELPGSRFVAADLTVEADCARAVAETVAAHGRLDVLVNNAGVNDSVPLSGAPADFLGSLQRNLLHVFSLAHHALPHLVAARGAMVNVTSKVAWTGQGGTSGYAASKGAINALTREWAVALAKDGVRVNGVDVRQAQVDSLRRAVGVVPQDTVLFNDTIFYNIHYGRMDAQPEEVYEAAKRAQIHEAILGMRDGYNTLVGERGLKLSGGEKQRCALARAFLKSAQVLVCDEATSALDSRTEGGILDALAGLTFGRTSVFVAHRLSTVMHCDQICVLDAGRVVEQGTHEELLTLGGTYAQMWAAQNSKRDDAALPEGAAVDIERAMS